MQIRTACPVDVRGCNARAKDMTNLASFKHVRSALHPECGKSQCHEKCHQLRYFIRMFNFMARDVFHLGPNVSFDEGSVAMRSRCCPARQHNKDKLENIELISSSWQMQLST